MNRNATSIAIGLVGLALGGLAVYLLQERRDPCANLNPSNQAKYVICFGDLSGSTQNPVYVDSGFEGALDNLRGRVRINTLTKIDGSGGSTNPGPAPNPTPTDRPVTHLHVVGRRANQAPCTMHVTQKVGLDNMTDVASLLSHLDVQP